MHLLWDSFWRAALYCLHPRVILISLLPIMGLCLLVGVVSYFFWSSSVEVIRLWLENSGGISAVLDTLTGLGMHRFRAAAAPLILIIFATPILVVLTLLVVALLIMPALLKLVARRRFATLAQNSGALVTWLSSMAWSLGSALLALVFLLASMPLWLVPPLIVILPPLIWGWLTFRVMSFDALSRHASPDECKAVIAAHRGTLLLMGIVSGYLGALPALLWTGLGAMAVVFAVILLPLALWLYTLIFVFSSLWFIHYCLAALEQYRSAAIKMTYA